MRIEMYPSGGDAVFDYFRRGSRPLGNSLLEDRAMVTSKLSWIVIFGSNWQDWTADYIDQS